MNSPRPDGLCYACWRKTDHYREYNRNEKRRAYQSDPDLRELTKERTLEHYHWKAEEHDFRASEAARKRAAYRQKRGQARGSSGRSAETE